MGAMGIGMLTLSIGKDKLLKAGEEVMQTDTDVDTELAAITDLPTPTQEVTATPTEEPTVTPTEEPTATPTEEPTKVPLPVYKLERDAYPDINDLFNKYYVARLACDMDMLSQLTSDISYIGSVEEIQVKTEYIEDYRNIECYTKKTYEDGSYIVYVTNDIKFVNIDTLAPAINKFYVKTNDEGKLYIYVGEVEDEFYAYYMERQNDEDVTKLYEEIEARGEEAKNKDEALMKFWRLLDGE